MSGNEGRSNPNWEEMPTGEVMGENLREQIDTMKDKPRTKADKALGRNS